MADFKRRNKSQKGSSKRKNYRKDNRVDKRDLDEREAPVRPGDKMSSLNDISWYSKNPNLLVAAGAFPYPYRPGMELQLGVVTQGKQIPYTIPGIMTLAWVPSFGNSSMPTDPASILGKEFYGRVRATFNGVLDADAPDYPVYLGALDSVFAYIGWLKRIYRVISTYSPDNYMLPDGLMAAMGFSVAEAVSLRRDKVRFWQGINELILKSRKFKCPAVIDYFNRHYWMSDNIYADAASAMAQLYMFNLAGVYMIAEMTEASSGTEPVTGLQMTPVPGSLYGGTKFTTAEHSVCDTLLKFGESLIQALDAWDDCYTISGYLRKAFDGEPDFIVSELLQDELATAQFVPEVLAQIENSRAVLPGTFSLAGSTDTWYSKLQVTQNTATNAVVSNANITMKTISAVSGEAQLTAQLLPNGLQPMLSIRSEAPTVADTVIASRLHAYSKTSVSVESSSVIINVEVVAGSEIPLRWSITRATAAGGFDTQIIPTVAFINVVSTMDGLASEHYTSSNMDAILALPQFDWHPFTTFITLAGFWNQPTATTQNLTILPNGDTHNITTVTVDMLRNLHKVCLYSEFNSFNV